MSLNQSQAQQVHNAYKTVKAFFYTHSIGEYDEQNIFMLEPALFCLKHKVSKKKTTVTTDFFGKKLFPHRYQRYLLFP
jgi:hypothetical protein